MAHILGVLAVATFLLSFQFKTRRNIIIVNLTSILTTPLILLMF